MKGLPGLRLLVDGAEGIAHLEMVTHTKAVHHLTLRIVLLREDVIVAIGLEEGLMLSYCASWVMKNMFS